MAAGNGSRMQSDLPKQFIELNGKSILHHCLEMFMLHFPDVKIVLVMNREYVDYWKNYCLEKELYLPQILVPGGLTRFHSVKNALEKIPDGVLVGIHDGVRPFVSKELVERLYKIAEAKPAVIPVTSCTDTIKILSTKKDISGKTSYYTVPGAVVDRSKLFGAQTPQVFQSEYLKKAYTQAFDLSFTDDASVALSSGVPIDYLEGEKYNIKITTKEDLILAKAIISIMY